MIVQLFNAREVLTKSRIKRTTIRGRFRMGGTGASVRSSWSCRSGCLGSSDIESDLW